MDISICSLLQGRWSILPFILLHSEVYFLSSTLWEATRKRLDNRRSEVSEYFFLTSLKVIFILYWSLKFPSELLYSYMIWIQEMKTLSLCNFRSSVNNSSEVLKSKHLFSLVSLTSDVCIVKYLLLEVSYQAELHSKTA